MSSTLAYEKNVSLAFDTEVMRQCANNYAEVAETLESLSNKLTECLQNLTSTGWTTPAGTAFSEMVDNDWSTSLAKYISLMNTLSEVLNTSATSYDNLVTYDINKVKLGDSYNAGRAGGRF